MRRALSQVPVVVEVSQEKKFAGSIVDLAGIMGTYSPMASTSIDDVICVNYISR